MVRRWSLQIKILFLLPEFLKRCISYDWFKFPLKRFFPNAIYNRHTLKLFQPENLWIPMKVLCVAFLYLITVLTNISLSSSDALLFSSEH